MYILLYQSHAFFSAKQLFPGKCFCFQVGKEGFHGCVIQAVALPGMAAENLQAIKFPLIGLVRVLSALVRVQHCTGHRLKLFDRAKHKLKVIFDRKAVRLASRNLASSRRAFSKVIPSDSQPRAS